MLKLSTALLNSMLSNEQYSKTQDELKQMFLSGDRTALMYMLISCSLFTKVIPEWVADELLTLDGQIDSLKIKDLNEFFGFKSEHASRVRKEWQLYKDEELVIRELIKHRRNGGNFTVDDGLDSVAKEIGISRRRVEAVYRKHSDSLKKVPLNPEENFGYLFARFPSLKELAKHTRNKYKG